MSHPVEDSWVSRNPSDPVNEGSPAPEANPAPTLLDPAATLDIVPGGAAELPCVPGYEVLARIGHGGMGVVFRARDLRLGRLVALKMIRDGLLATPAHVARFQAEARAVARLQHPHIVQIFHVGEHQGRPYFALELVEGGNLAQRLQQSPRIAARATASLIETLARAMQHAHEAGIVHRDLKPANVLLASGASLEAKITDFGLAKELEAELFLSHSGSGTVLGTPSYMAPEQAWGDQGQIGPAADIYALGAILYECLTGKPPFVAGSLLEVLDRVRDRDPVPPRRLNPKVPRDLETICLKCLRKEPAQRYTSAAALADDLGRFLRGEPIRARPVGTLERAWKWIRRRPALAAMSCVVALTLTVAVLGAWHASSWAERQREVARADVRRANYPALLQQAQQALTQNRPGTARRLLDECPADVRGWEWRLLADQADGHRPARLGGLKAPVQAIAFDPVRHHLYAATETGLRSWDSATLAEFPTLETGGRVKGLAVSPDGRYLAALVEPFGPPRPVKLMLPLPLHWLAPVPGLLQAVPLVRAVVQGGSLLLLPGMADLVPPPLPPALPAQAPVPPSVLVLPARRDEVRIWDLASRRLVIRWNCPSGAGFQAPVRIAFQPGGHQLAVLASARAALRPPAGVGWWRFLQPDDPFVWAKEIAPEKPRKIELPVRCASLLAFFDLARPEHPPRIVPLDGDECHSLAYSPDGKRVALGSARGLVRLLDSGTGRVLAHWQGPAGGTVVSLTFDASGSRLAAGSVEGHIELWNAITGELLYLLPGHSAAVRELYFHPRQPRLFSLGQDGHLKIWHLDSGQVLSTLRIGVGPYFPAMSLDARGEQVAVASALDNEGNFGLTLFGTRAAGKPAAWQHLSPDPTGFAQRRFAPPPQDQLPSQPMGQPRPEPAAQVPAGPSQPGVLAP